MPQVPVYPPGTTINDRYELRQKLGSDGHVYEAFDRTLQRLVALKLLHPEKPGQAQAWDEAQRLEHLRSRFLIDVLNADVIVQSDIRYIATPLVTGGDLEAAARPHGLCVRDAVRYAQQLASGIDRIHAAGMVHRDIKPANVLRTGDNIFVSDLQFCEILAADGRADRNGSWCTLAPETAADQGYCSVKSDVYSLGATAFYLLSGEYPVDHRLTRQEQKHRIERGDIREIRSFPLMCPRRLERWYARRRTSIPLVGSSQRKPSGTRWRTPPARRGTGSESTIKVICTAAKGTRIRVGPR